MTLAFSAVTRGSHMVASIEVWRGGETTNLVRRERGAGATLRPVKKRGVQMSFRLASKGGGNTWVVLYIKPTQFRGVARAMLESYPGAASAAFRDALLHGENEKNAS
jgi:hypothetical protein